MTDTDAAKRLHELQDQVTDISFSAEGFDHIRRLLAAMHKNFDEIDPYILDIEDNRLQQLAALFDRAEHDESIVTCRLSHLDMFDLERISLTAEGYHHELGGADALNLTPEGLQELTENIGHQRKAAFGPLQKKSAGHDA